MAGSKKTSSYSSAEKSYTASSSSGTIRPENSRAHGEAGSPSSRGRHHGHRQREHNQAALDQYMRDLDRLEHFRTGNKNYPLERSTSREQEARCTIQSFESEWAHGSGHSSQRHSNGGGQHGNYDSHHYSNDGQRHANHHSLSDDPHHRSRGSNGSSSSNINNGHPNHVYTESYYYPRARGEPRSQRGSGQDHRSHGGDDKGRYKGDRCH